MIFDVDVYREHHNEIAEGRMQRTLAVFENGLDRIPEDLAETRRRLAVWHRFYRFMLEDLEQSHQRRETWLESHRTDAPG